MNEIEMFFLGLGVGVTICGCIFAIFWTFA